MVQRLLEKEITKRVNSGKAIVLLGPRQTGKTTLFEKIASSLGEYLLIDCDQLVVREKLLMGERKKYLLYNGISANTYFWRTTQQQEIDYIEERGGKFYAYEFKWNSNAKEKFSKTFTNAYDAELNLINRDNFQGFLGDK